MKRPWAKFYWQNHDAEPGLRMCSAVANGIWVRMLGIMAFSEPPGYLVQFNGKPIPDLKLHKAIPIQTTFEEVVAALKELEEHGVFSRTPEGVIYCRRMVREDLKSRKMQALAQKSWEKRRTRPAGQPASQPRPPRSERAARGDGRFADALRDAAQRKEN